MSGSYDVVVIGGGPAGVVAAVQAARAGSRTLLVERSARLGGTTVNAGINRPASFDSSDRPVVRGIGWELVQAAVAEAGNDPGELPESPIVEIAAYASVCDEAVLGAGADLLLHTLPATARHDGEVWLVELCGIDGVQTMTAHVVVDATGDANVAGLAGLERRRHAVTQPATLDFRMTGYRFEELDLDALNREFAAAIARGELKGSDGTWFLSADPDVKDPTPRLDNILRSRGRSANHLEVDEDVATARGRTALEVEGRRSVGRLRRFLARQPGFENLAITDIRQEVGVRETRTIVGRTTITVEDYLTGRGWPDSLCFVHYAVDRHGIDAASWRLELLGDGIVPQVPLSAQLPRDGRNIIVAGRSVSSDRDANAGLRVQAAAMAMGQVAGAVGALAVSQGCDLDEVPLDVARALLREHGAIVPDAS